MKLAAFAFASIALVGCARHPAPPPSRQAVPAAQIAAGKALRDAVAKAEALCMPFANVGSLEECGSMSGKSPARSAARLSVRDVHNARSAFMRACTVHLERCSELADMPIALAMQRTQTTVTGDSSALVTHVDHLNLPDFGEIALQEMHIERAIGR